ncbi:DUF5946 family protein [Bacillus sp. AFS055030]|uniref:DUF5946 family protein n=1 Tax=Bacillus sp. AFS055030 TaxID=2033507 RepID=UPI000BFC33AC|nr:DUF5946 family protein [Bacillus sp. AFS055030]PGL70146.1 serine/threonine protein kinase [Bacillus sp. AFS055030]
MKKSSEKIIKCPGCGLSLDDQQNKLTRKYNATDDCFSDLSSYTLEKQDTNFIHQHAIDTYAAQHSGNNMKNITASFSVIGLYYAIVHDFNGKQVQRVHTLLSRQKYNWDALQSPDNSAYSLTVYDVMKEQPGENRDKMLIKWMNDVWKCWNHQHEWVKNICNELLK